jgi:hypothetical protein
MGTLFGSLASKCPCGGGYERSLVQIRMAAKEPPVVLEGIPQGVCPNCGGRVYDAATLDLIEAFMHERPPSSRRTYVDD